LDGWSRECEDEGAGVLREMLRQNQPLRVMAVERLLGKPTPLDQAAVVAVAAVDMRQYDSLLEESETAVAEAEPSATAVNEAVDGSGGAAADGVSMRTAAGDVGTSHGPGTHEPKALSGGSGSAVDGAGAAPATVHDNGLPH